jgi:hypothetical protein
VVDWFAPPFCRRNGYLEVFLGFILPDKVSQTAGAQAVIQRFILFDRLAGYDACYGASPPSKSGNPL